MNLVANFIKVVCRASIFPQVRGEFSERTEWPNGGGGGGTGCLPPMVSTFYIWDILKSTFYIWFLWFWPLKVEGTKWYDLPPPPPILESKVGVNGSLSPACWQPMYVYVQLYKSVYLLMAMEWKSTLLGVILRTISFWSGNPRSK